MADFKKVINGFRQCTLPYFADEYETQCHECPYYNPDLSVKDCTDALKNDVLELLKEQQKKPVKPSVAKDIYDPNCWYYVCGECSMPIDIQDNFCKHCGRPVEH